jgi:iron complex transport system substrate-binding protein
MAALVASCLVVTSCGSDEDAVTDSTPADTGAATPAPPAPSADTDTTAADAVADQFPVTIEHKYGETTIDAEPERVVSIGYGEHDGLLALGVVPVAVREWYGEFPSATWPWAQDALGDARPEVLSGTDLNFEAIAALRPDVIMGISSGMSDDDYEKLSQIAPTVAQPDAYVDYGTPWDVSLEIAGRALGRAGEAAEVTAATRQLFDDAIDANPGFAGATAAVTFFFEGQPGAYASQDVRSRALVDLGFVIPPEIDDAAGDAFFTSTSAEDLSLIDTDVVVWIVATDDETAAIRDLPTRTATRAFTEGREILADPLLSGAFSHSSPLSLAYVIDELVPELALAVDGDPTTAVPSAASIDPTGSGTAGGTDDPDPADAAAAAWSTVFDSTVAFEDKAPFLADADDLRSTLDAYRATGSSMGGIALDPTGVAVDGDVATVTYDVLFGGTAAYSDQTGTLTNVDGTWQVGRDEFCSFMASARTPCEAE